ncbi:hypothetical protein CASFOL_026863 [Castilleja foliolosa]|uniref:Uncharacterized protein n=1 Tax=Castilleja foliolosa TaxID=1961234 RepID=A0ABD3CJX8_9LAMI
MVHIMGNGSDMLSRQRHGWNNYLTPLLLGLGVEAMRYP